jgi:hypothetical protein
MRCPVISRASGAQRCGALPAAAVRLETAVFTRCSAGAARTKDADTSGSKQRRQNRGMEKAPSRGGFVTKIFLGPQMRLAR